MNSRDRRSLIGAAIMAMIFVVAPAVSLAQTPVATPGTRSIAHAMGTTDVPAEPRRVVVLDDGHLNTALAVGVTPVGAVLAFEDGEFPSYLAEQASGIAVVGTISEPNLELIVQLNPDLIIGSNLRHEAIYPQLSAIAPTVFTETVGVTWKENLLLEAEALGREATGRQLLADYDARLADLRQQAAVDLGTIEVSIVRFLAGDVRIYQKASFIGVILEDAGFSRPEAQDVDEFALTNVSLEQVKLMDGDIMFVTIYGDPAETAMDQFLGDPVWSTLEVVQAGNVHQVPDEYWMVGIGIIAANLVIDDLESYFLPVEASE
jgi:iron complex transport system substrate-binding protein